jgi:hypothetical protein
MVDINKNYDDFFIKSTHDYFGECDIYNDNL